MTTETPTWPALAEDHPLSVLHSELASIFSEKPPHKIWGITLSPNKEDFLTKIILQKFLRANKGDKELALKQLKDTLEWRRQFFDVDGKIVGTWDEAKFKDLGYITTEKVKNGEAERDIVVTWNIYGNVKDFAKTFGDVQEFLRWRVDLMERSLELLDLASAKEPIPDYDPAKTTVDPYKTIQVHDYLRVSFLRSPSEVKTASKKTIEIFQQFYPELLDKKFFVNVPLIMSWMYTAMRALVAKETFKKLMMLSYGAELAKSMGSTTVPAAYGGTGEPLKKDEGASKENLAGSDGANDDPVSVAKGGAADDGAANVAKGDATNDDPANTAKVDAANGDPANTVKDDTAKENTDKENTDKENTDKENVTEAVPTPAVVTEEPVTAATAVTSASETSAATKALEDLSLANAADANHKSDPVVETTNDSPVAAIAAPTPAEVAATGPASTAAPSVPASTPDAAAQANPTTAEKPEKN